MNRPRRSARYIVGELASFSYYFLGVVFLLSIPVGGLYFLFWVVFP